jgi:isoleucyl-tRNA synthetase
MYNYFKEFSSITELEKVILDFWETNDTFNKSISSREGKPGFAFYEGPPTANGKPGIHHVIARTIKDTVCRYKTLRGFQVHRKAGWDTQGLPVEIEIEKALGMKTKDDIEKFGVDKFNKACKDSVFKYLKEWETLTERMAYWVNLKDAYVTYTNEYIESVWWALKRFFDEGFIYKGYKIQPYCPRCETPLSSHEVAQGYEDVKDPSVYVIFKISEGQNADGNLDRFSFLVWTTTPWTLISNVALAVGSEIDYVKIKLKETGDKLILAKERLSVIKHEYEYLGELKGSELANIEYEQLLPYCKVNKKAFYVTIGSFVTTEDGSGIVHIAPAFGEDDYQIMRKFDLPLLQPVDKSGKFTEEVTDFYNMFVKDADEEIVKKLKSEGKLYRKEKYLHSYPHCWRCHTPLLYYARDSWYINTSSYKDKMIKYNNEINWFPPEIGSGRFGNWLEENRDWALSRDRYWGTPLPIWECTCDDCDCRIIAIGSVKELIQNAVNFDEVFPDKADIDLHKPKIDNIKIKCNKCGCEMKRVEEVIDAWFDSGSMPFAQFHYPFENRDFFIKNYPADFIAEGIDQTRGWFYSLHAIGTFLFGDKAFKNILVNDLILDSDGQKMSKHKGNVVNPFDIMEKYGADILRWYLISNSPPWRPKTFNENDLIEVKNKFFDTLLNTFRFFVLYSEIINFNIENISLSRVKIEERSEIDRWIISELNSLKLKYYDYMDNYDLTRAVRSISDFTIDHLSNWYVRRNRKRFRNPENEFDKISAYQTLFEVLVEISKLISPISPFFAEYLYKNLVNSESVHLSYFEDVNKEEIFPVLEAEMETAQKVVYIVRTIRVKNNLKTRQPLRQIFIPVIDENQKSMIDSMKKVILEEINVKELKFIAGDSDIIVKKAKPNFKTLGPKFGKDIKKISGIIAGFNNEVIDKIESDDNYEISIDNDTFKITKEDIIVHTKNVEGLIVDSYDGITVAVDTQLDEELVNEGFAREFINRVQNLRKEMGLGINDKIKIKYNTDSILRNALTKLNNYITNETFSDEFLSVEVSELKNIEEVNINGLYCKIQIEKLLL